MALIFIDGFDHYTTSAQMAEKWDTVDIASINTTGGRFGGGAVVMNALDDIAKDFTSISEVFVGFAFRTDTFNNALARMVLFSDGITSQASLHVTKSGALIAARGATVASSTKLGQTDGGVVRTDTWHTVEIRLVVNNTTGVFEVQVDGVQVLNLTSQDTQVSGNATVDEVELTSVIFIGDTLYDDVYILDTTGSAPQNTFLDDWKIDTLYPDGDGNYTEFGTVTGGGTHHTEVDETTPDDDTTKITSTAVNQRDTFTMDNLAAITSQTIFGVQQVSWAQHDGAATNFRSKLRISATDYDGASQAGAASYGYFMELWDDDPNAGPGAWVESVINAMESGVESL